MYVCMCVCVCVCADLEGFIKITSYNAYVWVDR